MSFTFWSLSIKFATGMTIALVLNSNIPYKNFMIQKKVFYDFSYRILMEQHNIR